jgi:hypothetical protein
MFGSEQRKKLEQVDKLPFNHRMPFGYYLVYKLKYCIDDLASASKMGGLSSIPDSVRVAWVAVAAACSFRVNVSSNQNPLHLS